MRLPICLLLLLSACSAGASPPPSPARIERAREAPLSLVVTAGAVTRKEDGRSHVESAGMRAYGPLSEGNAAELRFSYLGPSVRSSPLADGTLRRQIGLKLRARDTCNLVYVMWHLEPTVGAHVSVKRNPGATTHADCGAGGYVNVKPSKSARGVDASRGEHALRAAIRGDALVVALDDTVVWEGTLPDEARELHGPVGARSDNGMFDFALYAPSAPASRPLR